MKKEVTEECISVIDDLLKTLEADRGWLYIGSRENAGFLRAMEAVKEKRDALERSKEKWKNDVSREEKVKMDKERTKVGDIRMNKGQPEICMNVLCHANGWVESEWADYEENLLRTRMGMCSDTHEIHPLQHFVDTLNANQPIQQKDTIKIRYAYITSLTNVKEDPFYREYLTFRTLTLNELETLHGPLEDLLTLETTTLIKILGRDLCTGRVDMDGKDIYEGDIIRWYLDSGNYIDETIHQTSHFTELDSERDCKVIGTIYDEGGI